MDVFRITFKPAEKKGGRIWEGEVLIDASEFQPVLVTTHMARGVPMAVKIIAGTDVTQMGFSEASQIRGWSLVPYQYGGELRVRALFVCARRISIGAMNSDFRQTDVQSRIAFEEELPEPK